MLEASHIRTGIKVGDWQEAIKAAGELLIEAGSCTMEYVEAMIDSVKELGPYIVITPHVALAHSRPSEAVNRSDMSLVVLEDAVKFNHDANDPVKLVFAFCAKDSGEHLKQLEKLALNLNPETVSALSNALSVEEVLEILK
jgi:PTS system ascorbate-specific IIA component